MSGVTIFIAALALPNTAAGDAASTVPACAEAAVCERRWQWTGAAGDMRPLAIRLVRGTFRIVRRNGPVTVDMKVVAMAGDPGLVRFDVTTGKTIVIFDVYPSRAFASWRECLPASSERGDFESSHTQIEAVIHAPASLPVTVDVMEQGESSPPPEPWPA